MRAARRTHLLRDAARVVRAEAHDDAVVDILPLGVVVRLFGKQRAAAHPAPRRAKVGKDKRALDAIDAALQRGAHTGAEDKTANKAGKNAAPVNSGGTSIAVAGRRAPGRCGWSDVGRTLAACVQPGRRASTALTSSRATARDDAIHYRRMILILRRKDSIFREHGERNGGAFCAAL